VPTVRLIPIDVALSDTLRAGAFERRTGATLPDPDVVQHLVDQTLVRLPDARAPWCAYLAVDADSAQVVATCAFKSAPSEGAVEIAYWTFEPFEGRGYAKAMAAALVAVASEAPEVATVVAHTLPEPNASPRVLTATGFTFAGDVIDPEDGPVWRWTRPLRDGGYVSSAA
jgi:RimJ/RimL family protein N-acetyltransferase